MMVTIHTLFKFIDLGLTSVFILKGIFIDRKGEFIILRLSDGIKIKWSIGSLNVNIKIDDQYTNKISGLCGFMNDNVVDNQTSSSSNDAKWKLDSTVRFFLALVKKTPLIYKIF